MRIEQFVKVVIQNSKFFNNSAITGSALYLLNVEVSLLIVNTSYEGHDGEGVIHLVNSNLNLVRVRV